MAEAAAIALTEDRLLYGTFELCSEGWLSRNDVACLIGEILGRKIKAERSDPAALGPGAAPLQPMFEHYDHHDLRGNPLTLAAVLRRASRAPCAPILKSLRHRIHGSPEMVDVNVTPFEVEVRTRYGDLVRADVYIPQNVVGPVPILMAASPYQKSLRHLPAHWVFPFIEYGPIQLYLDEGYAYVAMDVPGTGRSEGTWDFVSRAEGEAIHDMIEHVAAQDWSTGDVGMIGMSYYCWSQWNAARTKPPSLKCLGAYDGATDMYRDWMYHGGRPVQQFLSEWLFGSVLTQHQNEGYDVRGGGRGEAVYDILSHPFDDEWQRRRSPFWELDQIEIPVLSIGAWGKSSLHLRGNFEGFQRVKGPRKLVVTPADSFAGALNPICRSRLSSAGVVALVRPSSERSAERGYGWACRTRVRAR